MKTTRVLGLLFSIITVGALGYLSYCIFIDAGGFYKSDVSQLKLLEFSFHIIIVLNFLIVLMFVKDWKKVGELNLESHFQNEDLVDITKLEKSEKSILSLSQFIVRMIICVGSLIATLFVILFVIGRLYEVNEMPNFQLEDIIFIIIILSISVLVVMPIVYNLKLFKAKGLK